MPEVDVQKILTTYPNVSYKLGGVPLDEHLVQKNRILKIVYEQLIHPHLVTVFGIEEFFHGSIHGS